MNYAVNSINIGFDECRFLINCSGAGLANRISSTAKADQEVAETTLLPIKFELHSNFPNPVRNATSFGLDLPERSQVNLGVYDVLGRKVATLLDEEVDAGFQTVAWSLKRTGDVSPGVYFYRVDAVGLESRQHFSQTRKLLVVK